jgi:translation initiation factor 2B subunit (eIF-2B alpha/beta/delta family)
VTLQIALGDIKCQSLVQFFHSINRSHIMVKLSTILVALKRGILTSPLPCAKDALTVMHGVVNDGHFSNVKDMIKVVRDVFNEMRSIVPCKFSVGNVAKRVLYFIGDDTLLSDNINNSSNRNNDRSGNNSCNSSINQVVVNCLRQIE